MTSRKPETSDVLQQFDAAGPHYDGLVDANPGYHAHLELSASRMGLPDDGRGLRLLDAGCGTGASTAALVACAPRAEIVAVDGSAGMLAVAREKRWPATVRFVHSPIEALTDNGVDGPSDGIFAAYLIRNVADPDATLTAFRELLRPGGVLAVHEYSVADSRVARLTWGAVSNAVIIPMARRRTGDPALYEYLRDSVKAFDGAAEFQDRLRRNGFEDVGADTVPGWQRNVVHTFTGRAPR